MDKQGKAQIKNMLSEKLQKSQMVVLTEYRGLTMEQLSLLRVELRKSKSEMKISKNRLLKRAIQEDAPAWQELVEDLRGPVAAVFVYGDVAQATKSILEFKKENELLVVKGGVLDGKKVSEGDLKTIADLPPKEVLLAQILGSLKNPHRGLVTTLSGVARNLVQVINAIKDKKA